MIYLNAGLIGIIIGLIIGMITEDYKIDEEV